VNLIGKAEGENAVGEFRKASRLLLGKSEGKRELRRHRHT
jgi:hypothetical protein